MIGYGRGLGTATRGGRGRIVGRRRAAAIRALVAACAMLAIPCYGQSVDVRFAVPRGAAVTFENYGPGESFRGTLHELTMIMQDLGALYLKPGDRLDITVLGFQIAGIRPQGYGVIGGPRIVTGATPPFLRLAYVLRRDGRVAARGVDNVTDPGFQYTQNPRYSAGPLYYEKRILTDWFEDRFRFNRRLSMAAP